MKKVKTFVYQECMKLIENDSESDKLSIHQKIKSIKKCIYITKIETCFNTDNKNISWAANQHIRMISEGSCDTEDLHDDAEKV